MVDPQGLPYGVPMSLARLNNTIYLHGGSRGRKRDILKENNRVVLTCVGKTQVFPIGFTTHYQSALVYGRMVLVEEREEKILGLRLISEKYTPEVMDRFELVMEKSLSATEVYRLDIEEITGKGSLEFS